MKKRGTRNPSTKLRASNEARGTQLGVIGFGNMAEAIVSGLLKNKAFTPKQVFAIEPNSKRSLQMKKKYGVTFLKDMGKLCEKSSMILIAVKPQSISEVLPLLAKHFNKQLILSIVTGTRAATYQKHLGNKAKIIRIMPNTPALIGHGMTSFFANKNCTSKDKRTCERMFFSVGQVLQIKKEPLLDPITALAGSGPAFVYQFALGMIKAATKLGLNQATAKTLALNTLLGATKLMLVSSDSPEELTKKVTSKKGTTFEGLKVLNKKGFLKTIESCITATTKRAKELSNN